MNTDHPRPRLMTLAAVWLLAAAVPAGQAPKTLKPFSPDQRRALLATALKDERVVAFTGGQRVRALNVVPDEVDKDGTPSVVAVATLVNYGTGKAVRLRIAPDTGRVESVEPLPGRPQSSAEERQEAEALIKADSGTAALLANRALVRGGFVVDPPAGQPAGGRFLEFHLVTPDGGTFIAEVIVDLARQRVSAVRRHTSDAKAGGA